MAYRGAERGIMHQVIRHLDADDLARRAARRLVDAVAERQTQSHVVHVCLTGGRIATRIYEELATILTPDRLDPELLELWWGDERFVPTADHERLAGPTLAALAGQISLDPARTHPMPASDGSFDAPAAADNYARELGDTTFDICLLSIGEDGHVASIFPGHPSGEQTTMRVIAVQDSPKPPSERLSLTLPVFNESAEVWFLASGAEKAHSVVASLDGDTSIPAGRVHGTEATLWFVDRAAASELPYFECSL